MSTQVAPSVGHESDEALVERVRLGETAAFDALVRRYMQRAFALAYRIVGRREEAEDVVQESFIAALDHLDTYDPARAFRPWFDRIVVNRAINARRREQRHPTELLADTVAAVAAPPSAAVEQRELQECVREALDELPERQGMVIRLSSFAGLTSTEIGELLNMPPGTVRWEIHQARLALRDSLAVCRGDGR